MKYQIIQQYSITEHGEIKLVEKVVAMFKDLQYALQYCSMMKENKIYLYYVHDQHTSDMVQPNNETFDNVKIQGSTNER